MKDTDPQDNDSALGNSDQESSASLTSTILRYRTLHGRTYHSDVGNAQYWYMNCLRCVSEIRLTDLNAKGNQ